MNSSFCSKELLLELADKIDSRFSSPEFISILRPDELVLAESLMKELANDLKSGVCKPFLVFMLIKVLGITDLIEQTKEEAFIYRYYYKYARYYTTSKYFHIDLRRVNIDYGDKSIIIVIGTLNRAIRTIREYIEYIGDNNEKQK